MESPAIPGRIRTLLAESLREGAMLEGIPLAVRAIQRADVGDPSVGQPRIWTLIEFEIDDETVDALAEALSVVLAPGPWQLVERLEAISLALGFAGFSSTSAASC